MGELEYEPADRARPVVVERVGTRVRVVVRVVGLYTAVPPWLGTRGSLFPGVIFGWVREWRRIPKPSRAVFDFMGDRLRVELRDRETGEVREFWCPVAAVVQARRSRYGPGLWLNVTGLMKENVLEDLPSETVEKLEVELRAVLEERRGEAVRQGNG